VLYGNDTFSGEEMCLVEGDEVYWWEGIGMEEGVEASVFEFSVGGG
jgi:hypothetical protein